MTVYRFFIDQSMVKDNLIVLSGDVGKHARAVRLKSGEMFEAVTPGRLYSAVVESSSPGGVIGRVQQSVPVAPPRYEVHLFAGMLKASKMDFVVEKATELGVTSVTPVICSRSVSSPDPAGWEKKISRWRRIALSAAEQSRRVLLPEVKYPVRLEDMVGATCFRTWPGKLILAWEGLAGAPSDLSAVVAGQRWLGVLVGPEGGFSDSEVDAALRRGFVPVSLGPHVLTAETACIMAVGLAVFLLERADCHASEAGVRQG